MERYGLGVILYSFLNEEDVDSPNYTIAKYILEHMDSVQSYSIKEFSEKCNVSVATVSRFCRKAGLENFFELKSKIYANYFTSKPEYQFHRFSDADETIPRAYLDAVVENVRILKDTLDYQLLDELVDDLHRYPRSGAFGAMHMENTARSLQNDLFRCRKIINVRSGLPRQMNYLRSATEQDLIIIFSLSGSYLREMQAEPIQWKAPHQPKVYLITGNEKAGSSPYVTRTLLLPLARHDFANHPLDMNLVGSIVSILYYNKYIKQ